MHKVESKRFPKLFLVIFVGISSIASSSSLSSSSSDSSDDSKLSQFDRVCSKVSFSFNLKVCHRKKMIQIYVWFSQTVVQSRPKAGVCCGPCNPSKWEADIWGWLEVRRSAILHSTVNQPPHWACRQYGHTWGTRGWLGVDRWQLSLWDTPHSTKCNRQAASGHWVSLCVCSVVGWLLAYQLGILSLSCSQ